MSMMKSPISLVLLAAWLLAAATVLGQGPEGKLPEDRSEAGALIRLERPAAGKLPGPEPRRAARTPERNLRLSRPVPGRHRAGGGMIALPAGNKSFFSDAISGKDLKPEMRGKKAPSPPKVQGWGRNHAVSNYEDDQGSPSMAKDSQGRLYVAYDWLYSGTGKYEVWLARSSDGGNDWEDLFYLGDDNYDYRRPSLAATTTDEFFLFYQTDDTLGLQYIWSSGGDKWNFDYRIGYKASYPKCHRPRVAAGRKNDSTRVLVAWEYDYFGDGSDYDIGYAYSRDGGSSWLAASSRIADSVYQERFPSICISDSLIAVAYELYGNWGTNDSVDIMYSKTGGLSAPQDTAWSTGVYGIATTRHDRQPALAASGRYVYLAGQRAYNDQDDYDILVRHSSDGGKFTLLGEGFEGATFPPTGWSLSGAALLWSRSTNCSGYGIGSASAMANFYNVSFGQQELISLQFSPSVLGDSIAFDHAYATYSGERDSLAIYTSPNGGGSWNLMVGLGGGTNGPLNTGGTTTSSFVPNSGQWATKKNSLPAGTNRVRFTAVSAYGNNLYLDNIRLNTLLFAAGTSAEEKYPSLFANDTICYIAYSRNGAWAGVRKSINTGIVWSEEEIASDSNTAVQGPGNLSISLLGENPRVAWTDNRNQAWGLGTDIYFNTDARFFPRSCDLAPYQLTGWQYPLVPSKLRGTYSVSDTLRGMLTTARDTTFVDLCLIDSASVDVADTFRAGLFVDEWLYAYLEEERLPAWWPTGVIDYPMWVFGGRHTMSLHADYEERILYEITKDNNVFSKQWVWTPYRLPDDTTLQVPTPPVNVIDPEIPDYNCDGYWQASTNYWSAVGLKPAAGTDYALRVYTDAYGKAEGGFTAVAAESDLGPDAVEVIAIDGNRLTSGTVYYPGVYRGPKTGDGDYYLQFCLQDGTTPANGWSPVRRMGEYQVVHTYDVSLTMGQTYYAACSLAAGPAILGFAVFSPKGAVYKPRSQAIGLEDSLTAPGRQFSFVADTSGWHAVVVWHNSPAKDDTSVYYVGINTVPFGLPLAVSLAEFAATAFTDSIVLRWRTESEENSYQWLVERATGPGTYELIGTMPAAGASAGPREYRWCDRSARANTLYYYRIGEQDLDGTVTYYGPVQAMLAPGQIIRIQPLAAPNPFGECIKVSYQVPNSGEVRLHVYNVAGQRVRTLADGPANPGAHSIVWEGRDDGGSVVSAGCYFLRWEIGGASGMQKLLKVR
ncbi:MAG TPA: hypothetical protein DDW31_04995 [candidate division Zixibacteria bacterium]|nr:hypothetical protein [candidate division Zixibacteria bacterium]